MAERSEESATSNSLVKETVSTTETTEIETMTNGNQNDKPIVVENSSQVVQSDFTESSATSESNDQMNAITNGMSTVNIDKQPSNVTQPESQKEDVDSENHEPLDPIGCGYDDLDGEIDVTVTPTSILQAFCMNLGQAPDFQLMSAEGVVHAPTFIYRVNIGDLQTQGSGNSKKKAKHSAALCMLKLLIQKYEQGFPDDYPPGCSSYLQAHRTVIANFECRNQEKIKEEAEEDNPVGRLQEVCMKNKQKPPLYLTTQETGLPHEKLFSITCEVEINGHTHTAIGGGKSKKNAKRFAAMKMIDILKGLNIYEEKEGQSKNGKKDRVSKNKGVDMTDKFDSYSALLENFCTNIGHDLNNELDSLLVLNADDDDACDYMEQLETVATYIECNVKYNDFLPLDSDKLVHMCFVHLMPIGYSAKCPAIVTGIGESAISKADAHNRAAKNALHLFSKIRLTSKKIVIKNNP